MNDISVNRKLSPKRAIIIYKDRSEYSDNFFLESRDIVNTGGKFKLMAPVPLAEDVLKQIAKIYQKSNNVEMDLGMVADHLLYATNKPSKTIVIWFRPAMKKVLNFSDHLQIKGNTEVFIPATLYCVFNTSLYVFALADSKRPDIKTKLYGAPFFNIYADGKVCLGTAKVGKIKGKTFEKEADRFERAFYMAEQTGGASEKNCKTPLSKLWPTLIKSKIPFPSKTELKQHTTYKTFGDFLTKVIHYNKD